MIGDERRRLHGQDDAITIDRVQDLFTRTRDKSHAPVAAGALTDADAILNHDGNLTDPRD